MNDKYTINALLIAVFFLCIGVIYLLEKDPIVCVYVVDNKNNMIFQTKYTNDIQQCQAMYNSIGIK